MRQAVIASNLLNDITVYMWYDSGFADMDTSVTPSAANFRMLVDGVERALTFLGHGATNQYIFACSGAPAVSTLGALFKSPDANCRNENLVLAIQPDSRETSV